jgi:toxin ParE1/3/4
MGFLPVEISHKAKIDLVRTLAYLELRSPIAAARLDEEITAATQALGRFPLMGRLRPEFGPDFRSMIVSRQLLIYRCDATVLRILRVLDGRMDVEAELLK